MINRKNNQCRFVCFKCELFRHLAFMSKLSPLFSSANTVFIFFPIIFEIYFKIIAIILIIKIDICLSLTEISFFSNFFETYFLFPFSCIYEDVRLRKYWTMEKLKKYLRLFLLFLIFKTLIQFDNSSW